MPSIGFSHKFHAAAIIEPGVLFGGGHAERHGRKKHQADIFAFPVIGCRVAHLVLTGLNHIEHAERSLMFVLGIDADFHFTV